MILLIQQYEKYYIQIGLDQPCWVHFEHYIEKYLENEKLRLFDSVVEEDKEAEEDDVFEVCGTGSGFECMSSARSPR